MKYTQGMYPELLGDCVVVNAPTIVGMAWALYKPFLDKKTCQKIKFIKGKDWQAQLQEFVAPDQLPDFLGGTSVGVYPKSMGPWRPYINKSLDRQAWWPEGEKKFTSDPLIRGQDIELEGKSQRLKAGEDAYEKQKALIMGTKYDDKPQAENQGSPKQPATLIGEKPAGG